MFGKWHSAPSVIHTLVGGTLFALALALLGFALAYVPGLHQIGPLACTLLLAAAYRHVFGYPEAFRTGLRFSSGTLLRTAIVLFGLRLNADQLLELGFPLMLRSAGTVVFSLAAVMLLGRFFRADRALTLLLAVGTAICGAAAIAAISPIVRSKDEDTAIGAGLIAFVGTVFAALYAVILPLLPVDASTFGIWSGLTLHEIAHVAMAGAAGGPAALADGMLAKLCRVFLLVPVCIGLALWAARSGKREGSSPTGGGRMLSIRFPWFLLGFVAMSLFGTYALPEITENPAPLASGVSTLTTLMLAMAMAGLGLNVSLRDLRSRALRPLGAMAIASVALSVITWLTLL